MAEPLTQSSASGGVRGHGHRSKMLQQPAHRYMETALRLQAPGAKWHLYSSKHRPRDRLPYSSNTEYASLAYFGLPNTPYSSPALKACWTSRGPQWTQYRRLTCIVPSKTSGASYVVRGHHTGKVTSSCIDTLMLPVPLVRDPLQAKSCGAQRHESKAHGGVVRCVASHRLGMLGRPPARQRSAWRVLSTRGTYNIPSYVATRTNNNPLRASRTLPAPAASNAAAVAVGSLY
ncbi:hypothetical protein C8T65DRAFT_101198 [Cerioporus squamosus]|nr:hypothetical protein C8T65DRAFT_101198 [Cerioporus squamosus]